MEERREGWHQGRGARRGGGADLVWGGGGGSVFIGGEEPAAGALYRESRSLKTLIFRAGVEC